MDDDHAMNAKHASDFEQIPRAAPVPIYGNAPLTYQFVLEDHAVRHSDHLTHSYHLTWIRRGLKQ